MKKYYCVSVIMSLMFISCVTPLEKFRTNKNHWKPDDLDLNKTTLVVLKLPNANSKMMSGFFSTVAKQQEKMTNYMQEHYPYQYEWIDNEDDIFLSKYKDKKKYRYFLRSVSVTQTAYTGGGSFDKPNSGGSKFTSYQLLDFFITDRQRNEEFPRSGIPNSNTFPTFKAYIDALIK